MLKTIYHSVVTNENSQANSKILNNQLYWS